MSIERISTHPAPLPSHLWTHLWTWRLHDHVHKPPSSLPLDIFLNRAASASLPGLKQLLFQQMRRDIKKHLSPKAQCKLRKEVMRLIEAKQFKIHARKKRLHILQAMSSYASSRFHYGPVLFEWAESLLNTALVENRKLIFIARDGFAPYRAAQMLQEKDPAKYGHIELSLLYLSRTLVYASTGLDEKIGKSDKVVKEYLQLLPDKDPYLLRKYIQQEAHLKQGDNCLFVDVGFAGSIIPSIQQQLTGLDIDAQFCFLISHTKKSKIAEQSHCAWGFLAHSEDRPLEPVNKAGKNPAVHWLEDTHQYIFKSPKILISTQQGNIVPALVKKHGTTFVIHELLGASPQTCEDNPEEYLIKWYGLKGALEGVKDAAKENVPSPTPPIAWKEASEARRQAFGTFLKQLQRRHRFLLIRHT